MSGLPTAPSGGTAVIRFFGQVDETTVNALIETCDTLVRSGTRAIHLLISTPGGNVFHGVSAYNYLRGLPVELTTHNFGSVDSIGIVLFCAGQTRVSVPNARFLIHGVQANIQGPAALTEDQLQETLKSLQIDTLNIARIIAEHTKKSTDDIHAAMRARTTLDPTQAIQFGLVDTVAQVAIPPGTAVISIQAQSKK